MTIFPREDAGEPQDPGRSLGIIGLICSVSGIFCGLISLAGVIVSIVALRRSRRAGFANRWALAALIVGVAFTLISGVLFVFFPTIVQMPR